MPVAVGSVPPVERPQPRVERLILLLLCFIMLALLSLSVRQLSRTYDEATHLYSGYRYFKCGDFTFSPEHPPLARMIAAATLVPTNPDVSCAPPRGNSLFQSVTALDWFYSLKGFNAALFHARLALLLFPLVLCVLVWSAARRMFGLQAAVVATLLLIFEPNLLAYGGLVLTDMAVTVMFLFAVFSFYLWSRRPCVQLLVLTGIAVGLTLLAKSSGIIVLPVLVLLSIVDAALSQDHEQRPFYRQVARNVATVGVIFLIAYVVLWTGYGMRFSASPSYALASDASSSLPSDLPTGSLLRALEANHVLPQAYLEGLVNGPHAVLNIVPEKRPSLTKLVSEHIFPCLFQLSIRCTVAFLAMILLGSAGIALGFKKSRKELLFLLIPVGTYIAAFMYCSWNGGVRHLLPAIPFLIILSAAGCLELANCLRWVKYAIPCLLVLHAASSLHAFPNYISYGNELWGGPTQSYKHLGGTDWGQSYWQVKAYLEQHHASKCWVIENQLLNPEEYGLPCQFVGRVYRGVAPTEMDGTVFVSTQSFYSGNLDQAEIGEPFRNLTPTDTVGGSAFLVFNGTFDTRATASATATDAARYALENSQLAEARKLSDYAIQTWPSSIYGHYVHATILSRMGESNTAMSELEYDRSLALSRPGNDWALAAIDKSVRELKSGSAGN